MSVPEELVQAAAEALAEANPGWNTAPARREIARIALAAAFAALPVDEIREQAREAAALARDWPENADAASDVWIAAPAREFGEGT